MMASCTDLNLAYQHQELSFYPSAVHQTLGIFNGNFPDVNFPDNDMLADMYLLSTIQEQCSDSWLTHDYSDELSSCDSDKDLSICGSDDVCFSDIDNALNEAVMIINKGLPPSYEASMHKFTKPAISLTMPNAITTTNNSFITTSQLKTEENSNHNNQCKDKPVCAIKNFTDVIKVKKENLSSELESTEERKGRPPRNCTSIYSAANYEPKPAKKVHRPRVKKTIHLWEFLEEIVDNKAYSPKYITWVSRDDGVFRLVDSKAVARLWGQRKNRHDMTYEKMSRAIRYYYERGIIRHVMGQKLIYQFGDEINEKRREKPTKVSSSLEAKPPSEPCT